MRIASLILSTCLLALASPGIVQANDRAESPQLIEVDWLAEHIDDPNLVLLHVGDAEQFAQAHLPGARPVALDDISVSEHSRQGLMLQMPDADDLRERLQRLGISDDSQIVVYYGQDWVSPSTRLLFTLRYAGLGARSGLLNGGMAAWQRAGHAVSTQAAPTDRGQLSPLRLQDLLVDADGVSEHSVRAGVVLVDGRAAAYYDGVAVGGAHGEAHRPGHIRGARSIPFTEVTDAQLRLRPLDELRSLFAAAGVQPGDTVIGYCHIGQQATAMLFAAQLLGHPVRLYDGSFEDWSRDPQRPVETATTPVAP